jgi:transposase
VAEKGTRTQLEPVARQMFIDGKSLTAIEAELGVSRQTLHTWKGQTKKPSEDVDEWDKARARKANFGLRMEALLERELTYAEERQPGAIDGASLDNLSKLGALVVKFRVQENTGAGYDKAKVFLDNIQWIVGWLREHDPEGLKTLAADFDAMTMQFKTECMGDSPTPNPLP